jgi:hypothetical protein
VAVPTYQMPANAPQQGSSYLLDTLDGRFEAAVAAVDPDHGNAVALWTAHAVYGGPGAEERWYEVDPAAGSLLQSGVAGSASLFAWNGAISPDRADNDSAASYGNSMAMSVSTSSSSTYPAIQFVSKTGSGAQSALSNLVQAGGANVDFSCSNTAPCRWGDYSGATPDPAASTSGASGTVWLANQYDKTAGNTSDVDWLTWIWSASPAAGAGGPPTISGFSPTSGSAGSQVVITGTNFANVLAVAVVKGSFSKAATFTVDSPTQITATVPSGLPTGVTVNWKVTTTAGSATSAGLFTIGSGGGGGGGGAPTITGFSPTSGPVGSKVVITGTNFVNVTAVAIVKGIGSKAAAFTVDSPTQITATVPSIPAGNSVNWKVTTTAGSATSTGLFKVT